VECGFLSIARREGKKERYRKEFSIFIALAMTQEKFFTISSLLFPLRMTRVFRDAL